MLNTDTSWATLIKNGNYHDDLGIVYKELADDLKLHIEIKENKLKHVEEEIKHMTEELKGMNDIGKIVQVKIKDSNRNTLFGEIIANSDQKVA